MDNQKVRMINGVEVTEEEECNFHAPWNDVVIGPDGRLVNVSDLLYDQWADEQMCRRLDGGAA